MAMRNFWLDADIDGRKYLLSGGPRAKDGEMTVTIRMRDKGSSVQGLKIRCTENDGNLFITAIDRNGEIVFRTQTER